MEKCLVKTPLGTAELAGDENGITHLSILEKQVDVSENIPELLSSAVNQLTAYFEGSLENFSLKINPRGTNFQQKVWQSLLEIPYGTTASYLDLSKKLGDVKAVRAVAAANGKNPLWIIIPCHRVIGSDGSLTGYAGGLWRKKWLLEHENPSPQQSLF